MTGTKPRAIPPQARLALSTQLTDRLFTIQKFAEEVKQIEVETDPGRQWKMAYRLVDVLFHEIFRDIPSDEHAFTYVARTSQVYDGSLKGRPNRAPWRFRDRHARYRVFLEGAMVKRGFDPAVQFLTGSITPDGLLMQFQGLIHRGLFPRNLSYKLRTANTSVVQQQLAAWRSLVADWDQLTRVPYGIVLVSQGKPKTWAQTRQVALQNRVDKLEAEGLGFLACSDWVTIRNALQHGGAVHKPTKYVVEFHDAQKVVILPDGELYVHATAMALAVWLMLSTMSLAMSLQLEAIRAWAPYLEQEFRREP